MYRYALRSLTLKHTPPMGDIENREKELVLAHDTFRHN